MCAWGVGMFWALEIVVWFWVWTLLYLIARKVKKRGVWSIRNASANLISYYVPF